MNNRGSYGTLIEKNTASKLPAVRVIIPHPDDPSKILVVWRDASGHQSNMWEIPGGKPACDNPQSMSVKDVAREELYEEVGLENVRDEHLRHFVEITYPFKGGDERIELYLILESAHYKKSLECLVVEDKPCGGKASRKAYDIATGDEGQHHTHAAWIDIAMLGNKENPVMSGTQKMLKDHRKTYLKAVEQQQAMAR